MQAPPASQTTQKQQASAEHLRDLAGIVDELKSLDIKKKWIKSLRGLNRVAATLGHDRTRSELFPYIKELIEENDEEFLVILAEILPDYVDLAGGV